MLQKPMLSVEDLIAHSKAKGIKFDIMSESDAKDYLTQNNNYFKLTSYRKNYPKLLDGEKRGQYDGLDFAYLIELSRIDVEIRHIILKMSLDIEHFSKVSLIQAVERNMQESGYEDGYKIVTDFLIDAGTTNFGERATNISKRSSGLSRKINQSRKNPYCDGLVEKYSDNMPIWAFVEVITFGDLGDLIGFYSKRTQWEFPVDCKSLDRVRQLRNAAAHNNCIINDLSSCDTITKTPRFITEFVSSAGVNQQMRRHKLSNRRVNQIVFLLYVYDKVVKSTNTRKSRLTELQELFNKRIVLHADYFKGNFLLTSTYSFFKQIVSNIKI